MYFMFKTVILCSALALVPVPAVTQDEPGGFSEGAELLSEGTRLILRGLLQHLEPAAEGWGQLVEMLNDFTLYHAPEVLPNGDIIIRRKEPLLLENGDIEI